MSILKHRATPWAMWAVLLIFFTYQFVLRVSVGVMAEDVMGYFSISASEFGTLTSLYYFGYASMQLPLGILLDRFGPRYIATFCILICCFGAFLFAYAEHWSIAMLGRFFIGMGSSGAFISTSKSVRLWFDEGAYTKMIGITVTLGLFGAINGSRPIASLMQYWSWQSVVLALSIFAGILAVIAYTIIRNPPDFKQVVNKEPLFDGLKQVVQTPGMLKIACFGALMSLPLSVFADVWGVHFFTKVHGWAKEDASSMASVIYFGMCFGGPGLAFLAEKYNAHKKIIVLCAFSMALCISMTLFISNISESIVYILMFVMGFFCAYQVLVFSLVTKLTIPSVGGVVIGVTNMINMLAGWIFLPVVGFVLDFFTPSASIIGQEVTQGYQMALAIIPLALIAGGIGLMGTFIRKQDTVSA